MARPLSVCVTIAALLAAAMLAACGYHLGAPRDLPGEVRTLHIGKVENPTLDVSLTPLLHTLFRDEINKRDMAEWSSAGKADGIVNLEVVSVYTDSRVTTTQDVTLKFQVLVTIRGTLMRRADEVQVWDSGSVTGEETFLGLAQEAQATRRAMDFAVRRLVDTLTATF
ncbi:LPS assembly lipoprotein LptE [Desulfocurvibacter africanus]|uniref:Rare lipoprotein B n=1 Tax=Desulfocurvibacter africanus subsp. africanus str. Walvis Bay TaxID=690850 RepID=F3YXW0_DESAF|nr:LPS assembly lipoprotein LptE [Desulfocurvibacter africanus]EGJ50662.1 hypothetical protein Desaf_2338 [Desulfocurvibacter africanus subsp. africanus str. Walvis Bay]